MTTKRGWRSLYVQSIVAHGGCKGCRNSLKYHGDVRINFGGGARIQRAITPGGSHVSRRPRLAEHSIVLPDWQARVRCCGPRIVLNGAVLLLPSSCFAVFCSCT